jgi:phosphatidylglycerophosphate synthase
MLDGAMRRIVGPALDAAGRRLAGRGVTANGLTLAGFGCGVLCALSIAGGSMAAALAFLALNRLMDGLDGAVGRATRPTDRGGYLDIVLDFAFYALVPLAFAAADPARNALPAALLLACFYANGASFLAFAALAAKRGMGEGDRGP